MSVYQKTPLRGNKSNSQNVRRYSLTYNENKLFRKYKEHLSINQKIQTSQKH